MNDDQNGLPSEDVKISDPKSDLASVGIEIMPQSAGGVETSEAESATTAENAAAIPPPPPAPPAPPVSIPLPVSESKPTPIESPTNTEPTTPTVPVEKVANPLIKSLRTYERDVAETIRAGETTMSINLAEQKRRLDQNKSGSAESGTGEKIARGSLLFIMSVVLIGAAIASIGVTFYLKNKDAPMPSVIMRTIISIDDTREAIAPSLTKENIANAVQKVLRESGGNGTLVEIALKKESDEVTSQEFFETIAKSAPSAFVRALDKNWLLGFYSRANVDPFINEPFVIVEVQSFDNAYSGMLAWENTILADIGSIFKTNSPGVLAATNALPRGPFEDLIVKSRDTRVLRDTDGKILILYSFIDTKNLVITTNEEAFREIVNRFLSKGLVR